MDVPEDDRTPWGRVDDNGTVFVRQGSDERVVGQYPDGTPQEALAYFERKFSDLAGQVTLLEQRIKRGAAAPDVSKAVASLADSIPTANAVGDLAALSRRVGALGGVVTELSVKHAEETKAAVATAIVERGALVAEAEKIASGDLAKAQWKQVTAEMESLFERWQKHQEESPRIPKSDANELWRRFRAARTTVDTHRRAFFAELDSAHREARSSKQSLIEKAKALESKGADGIPEYRSLLDSWKATGRAGKKFDDTLWAQFKEAGDILYAAKSEIDSKDEAEFQENLVTKEALLVEAEPLLNEKDRTKAKATLLRIQTAWDAAGKVPRDKVKSIEDRLKKIETAVRKLDEDHWKRSNPEREERQSGFMDQLTEAIAQLERDVEDAESHGDQRKIREAREALEARRSWLGAMSR